METSRVGPTINTSENNVFILNDYHSLPICINRLNNEDVNQFVYLGSVVSTDSKNMMSLYTLKALFTKSENAVSQHQIKMKLMSFLCCYVGTPHGSLKIQAFVNICLLHIIQLLWLDTMSNKELRQRSGHFHVALLMRKRKWDPGLIYYHLS